MKVIRWIIFLLQCSNVYSKRPTLVDQVNSAKDADKAFNTFYSSFENEVIEFMILESNKKLEELLNKIDAQDRVIEQQIAVIAALNELLGEAA